MDESIPDDHADAYKTDALSKTARKREAEDLQKLGLRISELSQELRNTLDMPENLRVAIEDYLRFPSRGAKRRQLQFIGKVMRKIDTAPLRARLADLDRESADARFAFHQIEQWRDRLLADAGALTDYLDEYPNADRQALRHAVQKVHKAKTEALSKQHARELFRLLKANTQEASDQA